MVLLFGTYVFDIIKNEKVENRTAGSRRAFHLRIDIQVFGRQNGNFFASTYSQFFCWQKDFASKDGHHSKTKVFRRRERGFLKKF